MQQIVIWEVLRCYDAVLPLPLPPRQSKATRFQFSFWLPCGPIQSKYSDHVTERSRLRGRSNVGEETELWNLIWEGFVWRWRPKCESFLLVSCFSLDLCCLTCYTAYLCRMLHSARVKSSCWQSCYKSFFIPFYLSTGKTKRCPLPRLKKAQRW